MDTVEWFINNCLHEWTVSRSGHTGGWTVKAIADDIKGQEQEYVLEFHQYDLVSQISVARKILHTQFVA